MHTGLQEDEQNMSTRVVYVRLTNVIRTNVVPANQAGLEDSYDTKVLEEAINYIITDEWDNTGNPQPIDIKIIQASDVVNGFFAMITFEKSAALGTEVAEK